jgi:hypothetical protein
MMPQKEVSAAMQQQAEPDYGRYEGNQTSSASLHHEQNLREEPFGKVYPHPSDNTNVLCFALAVIALGLIVFFGILFVVFVGGTTGWASFAVACLALLIIASVGIIAIKTR